MRNISLKTLALIAMMGLMIAATPALAGQDVPQYLQNKVNQTLSQTGGQPLAKVDSEALLALLDSPEAKVRYVAIYTLGDIREADAVQPLAAMLTSPDPNLRRMSAHALGKIGNRDALLPLAYLVNTIDEQSLVRYEATKAMNRIPGGQSTRLLMAAHCTDCPLVKRTVILALQSRGLTHPAAR
ncbi:MAG: HEAT repeat domain-containing protein [Desulfarculaceae bacterium]|nr:HEAT repeat domain-containing protein [Desulfarculaceae bacterium]MCF8074209.1 HEAT repeat domain-containing protein [Desulfarculaceae bacterium]MCF8103839.1 HEAT repeat domain-containing protein [Desulfarculaceae bacterium]MCF8116355.1 HEAT repeat domain-containing protein [Desulfarculaceae bacterium]